MQKTVLADNNNFGSLVIIFGNLRKVIQQIALYVTLI